MSRNATWTNSDGLRVGFGTHTEDNNVLRVVEGGTVKTYTIELPDATALEATASITSASIPPQSVLLPRGSSILEATFSVKTVFTTSASGALDIGLWSAASTPVLDDINGIDAAIAVTALDAIGDVVICDGAVVGGVVPVGATSNSDCAVVFGYVTGVFTAGAGVLTLRVLVPHGSQGRTLAA